MITKIFIVNFVKNILDKLGLVIVKKKEISFDHNFNYSKLNLARINIIKNYKIENLITAAGKKLGSLTDPYYYALKESLPIVNKKKFIKTFKEKIITIIKSPRTAGEAINLSNSKVLSSYPEWSLVLPWDDKLIEENYSEYLIKFISKRKKLKKLYNIIDTRLRDNIIYDELAWESHAEQFFELIKSISSNGFRQSNPVPVNLFKYNDSYKLSLSDDGNHRIRVASILGIKRVKLKIVKIIDFQDINNWTNVKNKLYSFEEAKKIFINYFNYSGDGKYV